MKVSTDVFADNLVTIVLQDSNGGFLAKGEVNVDVLGHEPPDLLVYRELTFRFLGTKGEAFIFRSCRSVKLPELL